MTDLITAEEAQKLLYRADGADTSGAVARSIEAFSHAAPRLARTVIALHAELAQARADAKAAVAVVVERAAERLDLAEHDAEERDWRSGANAFAALAKSVRAIAPEDAIAEVAKLRAERGALRAELSAEFAACGGLRTGKNHAYRVGVVYGKAQGQADRDRLAAELAASRAREAGLRGAVEALCAVLDRNDKKGPIPDVEMMFCWLAAQGVRAAFRSDGLSYMQKGKTT